MMRYSCIPFNLYSRLPTCRDYFRDIYYKVEVTFIDKNNPNDLGFTLTLSQRTEYDQMVKAAAKHLEMDPTYLQFFKTQSYREAPGHALRCTFDGTLKDLLVYFRPKTPKKMFYQKLAIPIHELENKKQIKCTFLSTDQVLCQQLIKASDHKSVILEAVSDFCKGQGYLFFDIRVLVILVMRIQKPS